MGLVRDIDRSVHVYALFVLHSVQCWFDEWVVLSVGRCCGSVVVVGLGRSRRIAFLQLNATWPNSFIKPNVGTDDGGEDDVGLGRCAWRGTVGDEHRGMRGRHTERSILFCWASTAIEEKNL